MISRWASEGPASTLTSIGRNATGAPIMISWHTYTIEDILQAYFASQPAMHENLCSLLTMRCVQNNAPILAGWRDPRNTTTFA
jgi:hypothetical protein